MQGTLFLVATPIGNLDDLTVRARRVLSEVGFVACEDTRHSRVLLEHYGIKRPLMSLPAFAEGQRAGAILDRIDAGEDCALVTDAGTPAVSDPGERLVAEALERGIRVVPLPGASAVLPALSASGLPTGRFHFLGFLPRSGPERAQMLDEVRGLRATLVLYESPRRLVDTLSDLEAAWGDRRGCVARELTKVHEELVRGPLSALRAHFQQKEPLGELVLLVEGRAGEGRWSEAELRSALEVGIARGERLKALATELARSSGWPGQEVYRLGVSLKPRGG